MYTIGIDISRWQNGLQWQQLRDAGVKFAILKASQGAFSRDPSMPVHYRGAREHGMIVGAFHWLDPQYTARLQIENFMAACRGYEFDFYALDVEQQWKDWKEWSDHAITQVYDPARISSVAAEAMKELRSRVAKPVMLYTRASFIKDYAQPMDAWVHQWPLWLAHYPYTRDRERIDWETLLRDRLPKRKNPLMPAKAENWTFWQFSGDKFILPGCPSTLDLDFFNGDEEALRKWCSLPSQRTFTDDEKLDKLWAAHPELSGGGA